MRILVLALLGAGVVLVAMGPRECHMLESRTVGGMPVWDQCVTVPDEPIIPANDQ